MIHIFLEIIQSKIISFQDLYNQYIVKLDFKNLTCPFPGCKSKGRFTIQQYYNRKLTMYIDDSILDGTIRVKVIMCKSCGHSHALLPDFIVPYKRHSLNLILECLKDKMNKMKISEISTKYKISIKTIFDWFISFKKHEELCRILFLNQLLTSFEIINKIYNFVSLSEFLKRYFLEHKLFFLQIIRSP